MTNHLTPDELTEVVAGAALGLAARRHIDECLECAVEVTKLRSTLAEFRISVHNWADLAEIAAPAVRRAPHRRFGLATALALALLLAAFVWPVWRERRAAEAAAAAAFDAALLSQVDHGISRAVPETMEPLVTLVSWGNGAESN